MYPIIDVPPDAPTDIETVGSKRKFWYVRSVEAAGEPFREEEWLFKAARQHTGEDWSEKVAAELCSLLGLPHATYELARWTKERREASTTWRGVVTRRMEGRNERLMLGNELLAGHVNRYPRVQEDRFYRNLKYTLDLTLTVLSDDALDVRVHPAWDLPADVHTVTDVFVGFLLLDAWIGNTDRHDNNWGVIERSTSQGGQRVLAPTFDHASSLGRELRDEERHERLTTNDRNRTVQAYVDRCRSAFFAEEDDDEPMHPTDAFHQAAQRMPGAATAWLQQLENIDSTDVETIFANIPEERISEVSIEFALQQLAINRHALEY